MKELPKKYNHKETEARWQGYWLENKTYAWDESQPRDNTFVIDTPPPTVSGLLHMGHIFSYTQADFVARYQRMSGKTVFYPMGFDDNGLPTERLVEKVKKVSAGQMDREEFITLCKEVVKDAEDQFRDLFRSVALSVDWDQEYQTISPESRKISQLSFLDLFEKDRCYRQLQPCFWDPVDRTALAQADIEDKEMPGKMNDIVFKAEDSGEDIVVATTRPELLPGCVAVFCHPDDERYKHLVGKNAITPLFGVRVPILEDDMVDPEKGTGIVMCCTFGDQTDIHWWQTHKLPARVILDRAGRLSNMELLGKTDEWQCVDVEKAHSFVEQLNGLKAKPAKEKALELLESEGLLIKQEEITHFVKCAERSGAPLEILVTPQWFIKVLDLKKELLKKSEELGWHPQHMKIRMDQWIEGLAWDWCVSRQRYFGVPFPVWYSKRAGEEGKILVADPDQLPVDPLVDLPKGYTKDEVEPEKDVLDTWATSSVSPQLNSLGITDKYNVNLDRHKKLFPADLRPQAHEIIRTWAFYTTVKAYLHEQTVPWKHLMISGWCLASDKTKMSKSKGNVVTPVDLIQEKGTDAVRYWASTSRLGADTAYSEDVLKIGNKLVNKIWNATKFAAIHLDKLTDAPSTAKDDMQKGLITEELDKWVLSKLARAVTKATQEFESYEYSNARVAIEDFFWNDFCDNYLELVKARAYGNGGLEGSQEQKSVVYTIYHCLDGLLRLFAPFVPHITEELYSHIFEEKFQQLGSSIHARGTWPDASDYLVDEEAEDSGKIGVDVLNAVRKLKADRQVSVKWPLNFIAIDSTDVQDSIKKIELDLKNVTNAAKIILNEKPVAGSDSASCKSEINQIEVTVEFGEQSDAA